MSQDKHRHHKQPRYFLKGFSVPPSNMHQKIPDIWVYKKGEPYRNGENPSLDSIKEMAYGRDFYAYTKEDGGTEHNKYENILMSDFENPNIPILDKIRRLEEITPNEKVSFARYVGSMVTRGQWWKEIGELALNVSFRTSTEYLQNAPDELTRQKWEEELVSKKKEIIEGEDLNIEMIKNAEFLADIFINMKWRFLEAPDGKFFFTSDKPVAYKQLKQENPQLLFPISSKVTLSLSEFDYVPLELNWMQISRNWWKVDDKAVESVQREIATNAHREIYACENAEWLVDFFNRS